MTAPIFNGGGQIDDGRFANHKMWPFRNVSAQHVVQIKCYSSRLHSASRAHYVSL